MKVYLRLFICTFLCFAEAKSQTIDFRQDLDEVNVLTMDVQRQSLEVDNPVFVEQVDVQKVFSPARDNFDLIEVWESPELRPSLMLFQQVEMANIRHRLLRESFHELLLQLIGDINFINFIQRGDYSQFSFLQPRRGKVLDGFVFHHPHRRHGRFVPLHIHPQNKMYRGRR